MGACFRLDHNKWLVSFWVRVKANQQGCAQKRQHIAFVSRQACSLECLSSCFSKSTASDSHHAVLYELLRANCRPRIRGFDCRMSRANFCCTTSKHSQSPAILKAQMVRQDRDQKTQNRPRKPQHTPTAHPSKRSWPAGCSVHSSLASSPSRSKVVLKVPSQEHGTSGSPGRPSRLEVPCSLAGGLPFVRLGFGKRGSMPCSTQVETHSGPANNILNIHLGISGLEAGESIGARSFGFRTGMSNSKLRHFLGCKLRLMF